MTRIGYQNYFGDLGEDAQIDPLDDLQTFSWTKMDARYYAGKDRMTNSKED